MISFLLLRVSATNSKSVPTLVDDFEIHDGIQIFSNLFIALKNVLHTWFVIYCLHSDRWVKRVPIWCVNEFITQHNSCNIYVLLIWRGIKRAFTNVISSQMIQDAFYKLFTTNDCLVLIHILNKLTNVSTHETHEIVLNNLISINFHSLGTDDLNISFIIISALNDEGTCNSDSDCPFFFYHCCTGTKWCCPSGYICTGTSTCIGIG